MRFKLFKAALLAATIALMLPAGAQEFPSRPIKIVVPYAAGGGTDLVARLLASKLQEKWGTAYVENRGGAGGNLGSEAVYTAEPDGHTLLFAAQGPLVVNKSLYPKLSYDPDAFTPVSLVAVAYSALVTNPKVPAQNVQELIALAKASPNKLTYASQGIGTAAHLIAELFNAKAGVKMVHAPYRGSGPALNDLLAGHVDVMFGELAFALSSIQAGKLRALGVSSEQRLRSLPDVPPIADTLPGFTVKSWWALVAPPKTPPQIAGKLAAAVGDILKQPEVAKRLDDVGMAPGEGSPDELAAFMKQERELWGDVIRTSGAKAE